MEPIAYISAKQKDPITPVVTTSISKDNELFEISIKLRIAISYRHDKT